MATSERIRALRKEQLHLTQEAFGKPLGLSRANIANIEAGRITVTDRVIASVCKEFGVSEKWLKTGEGEMLAPLTRSETISKFAGSLANEGDYSFRNQLVEVLAELSEPEWETLEGIAKKLAKKSQGETP